MTIDRETVKRIATLARIRVPDADVDALAGELNGILGWVEQLQAVDTDGVEPMTGVGHAALRQREDRIDDGGIVEKVTSNAPDAEGPFFTVPKVVE